MPLWSWILVGANLALVVAAAILSRVEPPWYLRAMHRWQNGTPEPMRAMSTLAGEPWIACRCKRALRLTWRGPEIADTRSWDDDDGWIWHLVGTADAPRCPSLERIAAQRSLPAARAREIR